MKKLLLLICVFCVCCTSYVSAQNYSMQCTMTVHEIQQQQSWGVDDPSSEFVKNLATSLFAEINIVYDKLNNGVNDVDQHIQNINALIVDAQNLNMNYAMFDNDLEFIESLNQN